MNASNRNQVGIRICSPKTLNYWQATGSSGFVVYLCGYGFLIAWFKLVDVYHAHFATRGLIVVAYNIFRVLFIFYLFWIVYAAGALALRWITGRPNDARTLEGLVLGFFAGAGLWHIALLLLGYLNLYDVPVAIAITLPAVALSYPHVCAAISSFRRKMPSWRDVDWPGRLATGGIVVAGALLLLIKGLYPGGGHDYYTHYFYYYQAVIEHGGLWPNEVWYHYYYSKGLGLFFLGMLLTDPLAPQLVTFCFMAVAAAVLYLAVKDVTSRTNWPTASVLLFIGIYIFTPGWGEFEKDHELNTALVLGVIWMAQRALRDQERSGLAFIAACGLGITAAVIINTQIGLYFIAVFFAVALLLMTKRDRRNTLICLAFAACAGIVVTLILVLNYTTTGLYLDQSITRFWPLANVEMLYKLGSLPSVLNLYLGTEGLIAEKLPLLSRDTYKLIVQSLRLDLLYPLMSVSAVVAYASIQFRKKQPSEIHWTPATYFTFAISGACVLVCVVIALTVGRTQPVSYYRYSTFAVPVIILSGVTLWHSAMPLPDKPLFHVVQSRWCPLVLAGFCLFVLVMDTKLYRHLDVPKNPLRFAIGSTSIDDAYVRPASWSFHSPWGAIYPAARATYKIVGPHTPIWSLHVHTYCMLPDCRIEGFMSFNMTKRWDRVMFGSAEEARQTLQRAGINFFLFSSEIDIADPLPMSNLFSPDHIADYLALRWTDGTTSLLTWAGPDTRPLDDAWIAKYRTSVERIRTFQSPYVTAMHEIFDRYYAMPHPWRAIPLPW
jgi:hypothetical protein